MLLQDLFCKSHQFGMQDFAQSYFLDNDCSRHINGVLLLRREVAVPVPKISSMVLTSRVALPASQP